MSTLTLQDVRLALRRLRKDAGTTIASVAALAFAIGVAVATWSLLSAVLLKPLPVAEPERLFQIGSSPPPNVMLQWVPGETYPIFESVRGSGAFDAVVAGGLQPLLVVEHGDLPQSRQVYFAAHDFFATLGIDAARGRTFTADEDRAGAPAVAVLADHYWRAVFNADPGVLGRTVTVSGTVATIVGILPRGFRGLYLSEAPDLYLPLRVSVDIDYQIFKRFGPLGSGMSWIRMVGRLRPGETPEAAAARLNALDCQCQRPVTFGEVDPFILTNINIAAVPRLTRGAAAQFATLLSITVGLLLLIGCLTVAMLLLVRTEDRRDELAVRLALGATRNQLTASIVVEAAILGGLGALVAIPVTLWLCYGIRTFQLPGGIDVERLELDLAAGPWLAVTSAALAATGIIAVLASLVGAVGAVGSPLQWRALSSPRVTRPRTVLVAGQVAITLVLVTGAGLFARSLIEALSLNPGIDTHRILTAGLNLAPYGYTPESAAPFVNDLVDRLRGNALIESVSLVVPSGTSQPPVRVTVDGALRELPSALQFQAVEEDYFSTIGLPIVAGRAIDRSDVASSPLVAVVSESLAQLIADGGDPLGRRIPDWESIFRQSTAGEAPRVSLEVIGVVPDVIVDVGATSPLVVYQPLQRGVTRGLGGTSLTMRVTGEPAAAMREALATARTLDSRVTLTNMMTLDEQIGRQMNPQRFGVHVLGALGGIALLQTVLGTYVVAQSLVARRRRELGIRAALGARSAQLRSLVLRDTARLVGIGLIAGLALAVAGARLIRSLLYQVEPLDPFVLGSVAVAIFGLALLVSLRPALAATRVDLTRVLRED
jgi:putative ABC transport system permease protein